MRVHWLTYVSEVEPGKEVARVIRCLQRVAALTVDLSRRQQEEQQVLRGLMHLDLVAGVQ